MTPRGGIDCHVHLCDPARFPYRPEAPYTPTPAETGTLAMLDRTMAECGLSNAILVGPTAGYLTDNACLLDGLRSAGGRHRGIAVVDPEVSESYLDELARGGVIGIRLDLIGRGIDHLEDGGWRLIERICARGWLLDLQVEAAQLSGISERLAARGVRGIVDHLGRPDPALGVHQPGFADLLALAATARCWVKLSGPFRFSKHPEFRDADPYARAILDAFGPDRLVWGSDWPHLRADRRYAHASLLDWLERLVPDHQARRRILWHTPARLFGFEGGPK